MNYILWKNYFFKQYSTRPLNPKEKHFLMILLLVLRNFPNFFKNYAVIFFDLATNELPAVLISFNYRYSKL